METPEMIRFATVRNLGGYCGVPWFGSFGGQGLIDVWMQVSCRDSGISWGHGDVCEGLSFSDTGYVWSLRCVFRRVLRALAAFMYKLHDSWIQCWSFVIVVERL